MNMSERYLWDKRDGLADPFVARLEHALATERVRVRSVVARQMHVRARWLLVAAGLAAAALLAGLRVAFPGAAAAGGAADRQAQPVAIEVEASPASDEGASSDGAPSAVGDAVAAQHR
jgi:hypothetical protein